jgi:DNA-directed RNA polymerase I, II, and III subunit RPABC2
MDKTQMDNTEEDFEQPDIVDLPDESEDEEIDTEDESYTNPQDLPIGQAFVTPDDDEEDDDDEDVNYLQKFDEVTQQTIISDFHPELQFHNYHEIDIMSRVVRNEKGQIIDPLHKTLPFITRYEKARILGERAKQINSGGKPLVEVDASVIDGYLIAVKEFDEKKIPFILKRPLPNGGCEYWKFIDLEIIS